MEPGFFAIVRDAFEGFVAGVGGQHNTYVHSRGLKVWFDDDSPEHYESQLIRIDGEVRLEIGLIDDAIETAARLADYVMALEPLRRA